MSSNNEVKGSNILETDLVSTSPVAGDRLQFNGTLWVPESPVTKSYVHAFSPSSPSLPTSVTTGINQYFTATLVDVNSDFNTTTGQFTAPRAGLYLVTAAYELVVSGAYASGFTHDINLVANTRTMSNRQVQTASPAVTFSAHNIISVPVSLLAGQSITLTAFQNSGLTQVILNGSSRTYFIIAEV